MASDSEPMESGGSGASGAAAMDFMQGCCVEPLAKIWIQGDWQVKLCFLGVPVLVLIWAAIAASWSYWGTTISEVFHERDIVLSLSRTNSEMGERSSSSQSVPPPELPSFCSTPIAAELDWDEGKKDS